MKFYVCTHVHLHNIEKLLKLYVHIQVYMCKLLYLIMSVLVLVGVVHFAGESSLSKSPEGCFFEAWLKIEPGNSIRAFPSAFPVPFCRGFPIVT